MFSYLCILRFVFSLAYTVSATTATAWWFSSNNIVDTKEASTYELRRNPVDDGSHDVHLLQRHLQSGSVGQVARLRLVNAITGTQNGQSLIDPIVNGTIINLSNYASRTFNIEAIVNTTNGPVGTIRFGFGTTNNFRTEASAPFSFCGDTNGIYRSCPQLAVVGSYTVRATPYSLTNAQGVIGQTYSVSFSIIDQPPIPSPTKLPTKTPTKIPTNSPTTTPIKAPTASSTNTPTKSPTKAPTYAPTNSPTKAPTKSPTKVPSKAPTKTPTKSPTKAPTPISPALPAWIETDMNAPLNQRHEACFVMVGRRAYLLAGRGIKPVNIYNPVTRTWTNGASPPKEVHHTQCVAVDDSIWIVSSWTGKYPNETNNEFIYIYNTTTNQWLTKSGLPEPRRRGGAAAVLVGRKIYVSHGNRGGHELGTQNATSYGWLDYYDLDTDTWTTNLPDAPNPRDHTGGSYVNGRICVAGGRLGGEKGFFNKVVVQTDCYNPVTNTWSVEANLTQGRAGSSYGTTCDGKLMIAGGEGFGKAWSNVDVFDGTTWTAVDNLTIARHGSGLAVDCICNHITIASGSAKQGNLEIKSVETYFPNGVDTPCLA